MTIISKNITTNLFKLTNVWAFLLTIFIPIFSFAQDQLFIQRLTALRSQTELIYNPEVKKHIEYYIQNPAKTRDLISLSK